MTTKDEEKKESDSEKKSEEELRELSGALGKKQSTQFYASS